jgi:hypothetical protein
MPTCPPAVVSHHHAPRCAVASPHLEPPALLPLITMPARIWCQLLGYDALAQHALLAELSRPKARRLGRCIALSCVRAKPSRRHALAHARLSRGHAQRPPYLAHHSMPTYEQNPFRRRLHASPCRCPPTLRSTPTHARTRCPSVTMRSTPCPSHLVTLSLHAHMYKGHPHPPSHL